LAANGTTAEHNSEAGADLYGIACAIRPHVPGCRALDH
jgi:hypothetical protein